MARQARPPGELLRSVSFRYRVPLAGRASSGLRAPACTSAIHPVWRLCGRRSSRGTAAADRAAEEVRLQRLEAVLFLSREPLSSRKLSHYANLADGTEARTLVRRLNQRYDDVGRAFRVEEFASGFQLLSRPQFASWLRRLEHVPAEIRLSAPAMETLAVVAYRQPVLRADIEAIRGVSCGEILRQLMDRDLVRIGGRSEELGRPYLYCTTRRFLQLMGLPSLSQLPRAELVRADSVPEPPADPTESNPLSPPSSDSSNERQPEDAAMIATDTDTLQPGPEMDEVALLAAGSAKQVADDEDEEYEEYEDDEEFDDDEEYEDEEDDEEYEDDELEEDGEEEGDDEEYEDEEEFDEEEEYDEEEEGDEEGADEEEEGDEEEDWEEVDDEEDEEWEDEDMDWEDEYDEMD